MHAHQWRERHQKTLLLLVSSFLMYFCFSLIASSSSTAQQTTSQGPRTQTEGSSALEFLYPEIHVKKDSTKSPSTGLETSGVVLNETYINNSSLSPPTIIFPLSNQTETNRSSESSPASHSSVYTSNEPPDYVQDAVTDGFINAVEEQKLTLSKAEHEADTLHNSSLTTSSPVLQSLIPEVVIMDRANKLLTTVPSPVPVNGTNSSIFASQDNTGTNSSSATPAGPAASNVNQPQYEGAVDEVQRIKWTSDIAPSIVAETNVTSTPPVRSAVLESLMPELLLMPKQQKLSEHRSAAPSGPQHSSLLATNVSSVLLDQPVNDSSKHPHNILSVAGANLTESSPQAAPSDGSSTSPMLSTLIPELIVVAKLQAPRLESSEKTTHYMSKSNVSDSVLTVAAESVSQKQPPMERARSTDAIETDKHSAVLDALVPELLLIGKKAPTPLASKEAGEALSPSMGQQQTDELLSRTIDTPSR
eukprot:GILK01004400.1.p1 GENE.GILK01004400.1~~GILK01004400.1.p1  ORF type:complete len:489 (+),score=55.28 GILK01004400.1:45-1469(+)